MSNSEAAAGPRGIHPRWPRNGKIVEEYLKYDNASFLQQVGRA
jgi:hypothetical protein